MIHLVALLLLGSPADSLGVLWIENVHTHEAARLPEVGPLGRIDHLAWRRANRLFRSWRTQERRPVHPRLLRTLAHIQRHFGDRKIELVSGYRVPEDREHLSSYHQVGRAADIRIVGVSNEELHSFCLTLPRVGCGYYTSGSHVHVDVRGRAGRWVD